MFLLFLLFDLFKSIPQHVFEIGDRKKKSGYRWGVENYDGVAPFFLQDLGESFWAKEELEGEENM